MDEGEGERGSGGHGGVFGVRGLIESEEGQYPCDVRDIGFGGVEGVVEVWGEGLRGGVVVVEGEGEGVCAVLVEGVEDGGDEGVVGVVGGEGISQVPVSTPLAAALVVGVWGFQVSR
ncbi:hypothetical protein ACFQ2B_38880 [Streptomyces stramineus]